MRCFCSGGQEGKRGITAKLLFGAQLKSDFVGPDVLGGPRKYCKLWRTARRALVSCGDRLALTEPTGENGPYTYSLANSNLSHGFFCYL